MGLATIDPHSQKEHSKIHKIPKLVSLGDFVKLGLHFMTMWINSCQSHNLLTRTPSPSWFENRQ